MLKANKLFAMAAKLEEEGVITPNTEVEVSASVSVTPEEQEKIDEALTEVEEIATAEQELDESAEEIEDLGEAEATLSAIRDAIKREGIVTPQMYAFLQDAGYLEVIASFQKNVTYPASEAIANVSLNKQYADVIIAGCEAGISTIDTTRTGIYAAESLSDRIKSMFLGWIGNYKQSLEVYAKQLGTDGLNSEKLQNTKLKAVPLSILKKHIEVLSKCCKYANEEITKIGNKCDWDEKKIGKNHHLANKVSDGIMKLFKTLPDNPDEEGTFKSLGYSDINKIRSLITFTKDEMKEITNNIKFLQYKDSNFVVALLLATLTDSSTTSQYLASGYKENNLYAVINMIHHELISNYKELIKVCRIAVKSK